MRRPSITPNWKAGRWVDRTDKHNWKQYLYRDLFRYVVLINPYIRPSGRVNKYLQTKAGINYVQPQPVNSGNECGISCTVAVEKLNRLLFQLFLSFFFFRLIFLHGIGESGYREYSQWYYNNSKSNNAENLKRITEELAMFMFHQS